MNLQSFNPWWKTGKVSPEFTGRKRKIFDGKALLVTLDTETKFEKENLLIEAIPYWKYWSIKKKIN